MWKKTTLLIDHLSNGNGYDLVTTMPAWHLVSNHLGILNILTKCTVVNIRCGPDV